MPSFDNHLTPNSFIHQLSGRAAILLILGFTALAILPFSGKAFHVDDPFFIQVARHILDHPLNPYSFDYNWYGYPQPVAPIVYNPPLVSYYMAAIGELFGWSELALHLGFFLFTALSAVGIFRLSGHFTTSPLLATLAAVLTPTFLLSSSTLMLDVPGLACFIWAVHLWIDGLKQDRPRRLLAASLFMCVGVLTKYICLTSVPLLLVYAVFKRKPLRLWAPYLTLPLLVIGGYALVYHELYGSYPFFSAASFSLASKLSNFSLFHDLLVGLAFFGGGLITVLLLTPWCWSNKATSGWALYLLGLMLVIKYLAPVKLISSDTTFSFGQAAEMAIYVTCGTQLLALTLLDLWRNRNPESLLLALWIGGIFVFASLLSWSVNGRLVLLTAAPAGILLARRLQQAPRLREKPALLLWPFLVSALIGTLLNMADYRLAGSAKEAAATVTRQKPDDGNTIWFFGHWGFQHYMESYGAKAVDTTSTTLLLGDRIVVPENNSNVQIPDEVKKHLRLVEELTLPAFPLATTLNLQANAGFYSSVFGPLPFTFARSPAERYWVFTPVH
jgi:4-amino-4-deoxy-L-arabinose transferase-like glycosyltransferase